MQLCSLASFQPGAQHSGSSHMCLHLITLSGSRVHQRHGMLGLALTVGSCDVQVTMSETEYVFQQL